VPNKNYNNTIISTYWQ